jgi:hypothetical protein
MGKKSGSGSGMFNQDHIRELRNNFLVKILNSLMRILDPGWKKFGSWIRDGKNSDLGSGIWNKHPESAALFSRGEWSPVFKYRGVGVCSMNKTGSGHELFVTIVQYMQQVELAAAAQHLHSSHCFRGKIV